MYVSVCVLGQSGCVLAQPVFTRLHLTHESTEVSWTANRFSFKSRERQHGHRSADQGIYPHTFAFPCLSDGAAFAASPFVQIQRCGNFHSLLHLLHHSLLHNHPACQRKHPSHHSHRSRLVHIHCDHSCLVHILSEQLACAATSQDAYANVQTVSLCRDPELETHFAFFSLCCLSLRTFALRYFPVFLVLSCQAVVPGTDCPPLLSQRACPLL